MRAFKRLLVALALSLGLLTVGASGAFAAPIVPPSGGGTNNPVTDLGGNVVGGAADAILNKLCPPRDPPYPQSPNPEVLRRGGGPGTYATYGYGGLTWTTYDEGCLSMSKADTGIGSQINSIANSIDVFVNETQAMAMDPATTASLGHVVEKAVRDLHNAFWNPWAITAISLLGLIVGWRAFAGRTSEAFGALASGFVVVAAVATLYARPGLPMDVSNQLTTGVATKVASTMIAASGTVSWVGGPNIVGTSVDMNVATPREKITEGYYHVSYRAWLEGWSCGQQAAERRYGMRLLDAQAFTVAQTQLPAGRQAALVKAKQAEWLKIGQEMAKTDPAAFGCWKGAGSSRMAAAVKHLIVSCSAGFWIIPASFGLLALRLMLVIAMLVLMTFGIVFVVSQRLQDRMVEFAITGLLGPPFMAAGVGMILWAYYALLNDHSLSWAGAAAVSFCIGLALWMSKNILQRAFVGLGEARMASSRAGRHARQAVRVVQHTSRGNVLGGVAAGVAGGYVASELHDANDERRDRADGEPVGFTAPGQAGGARGPQDAPDSGTYADFDDDGGRDFPVTPDVPQEGGRTAAAADALYRVREGSARPQVPQDDDGYERTPAYVGASAPTSSDASGDLEMAPERSDSVRLPADASGYPQNAPVASDDALDAPERSGHLPDAPGRSDTAPAAPEHSDTAPAAPEHSESAPERASTAPADAVRRYRQRQHQVDDDGRRDDWQDGMWDERPET